VAKSTINIKQPLSSSEQSVRSEWDSEKLLCLSHFLIACSSCWDFVEDTGFETGQQEVIGKLSQIRQLNPLSLYDHMWWSRPNCLSSEGKASPDCGDTIRKRKIE